MKSDIFNVGLHVVLHDAKSNQNVMKKTPTIDGIEQGQSSQNRALVAVFGRFSYSFDPPTSTFPVNATSSPRDHSNSLVRVHPTSLLTGFCALGRAEAAANHSAQDFPKVSESSPPQTLDPPTPLRRPALNMGKTRPDFQRALGGLQPSQ